MSATCKEEEEEGMGGIPGLSKQMARLAQGDGAPPILGIRRFPTKSTEPGVWRFKVFGSKGSKHLTYTVKLLMSKPKLETVHDVEYVCTCEHSMRWETHDRLCVHARVCLCYAVDENEQGGEEEVEQRLGDDHERMGEVMRECTNEEGEEEPCCHERKRVKQ